MSVKECRSKIVEMMAKDYKSFVIALILEEYSDRNITEQDAEEIFNIYMEFDDIVNVTSLIDAYEIWYLEKGMDIDIEYEIPFEA